MKPKIAIPIGDAAGVGPEVVVKALSESNAPEVADCIVIGDKGVMETTIASMKSDLKINLIENVSDGNYSKKVLNLINLNCINMDTFEIGKIQAQCGLAAYKYIEKSINLALNGEIDAVATAPINKEALKLSGIDFIGHTEIFGNMTNTKDPLTMFEVRGLRVFFLSRHVSLEAACKLVSKDRIKDYIKRCTEALAHLGVTDGVMAVAGLNPHSGENGLFGNEEQNHIAPAVKEMQALGYKVEGPLSADSVFHLALKGKYNCVLSLYHDQGHIATKTLDFDRTISITCGMPILRTSVDHGTAMDIAGKNEASCISMEEAIIVAAKYSGAFANNH